MTTKVANGLDLQGQRIQNTGDPSVSTDVATKNYVDAANRGLDWHTHCRAAGTGNVIVTAPGASIDGVSMAASDRVLLFNQTVASQNGPWIWNGAASAMTRPSDFGAGTVFTKSSATFTVTEGTTYADKVYTLSTDGAITVDTTSTTWVVVGGGTTYTAGNGLTGATTFSVQPNGSSIDVSASGVKVADAAGGSGLTVASGIVNVGAAAGITVAADTVGVDYAVVATRYSTTVGDGSALSYVITHGLTNKNVNVQLYETTSGASWIPDVTARTSTTVTLGFAVAPASAFFTVVVE